MITSNNNSGDFIEKNGVIFIIDDFFVLRVAGSGDVLNKKYSKDISPHTFSMAGNTNMFSGKGGFLVTVVKVVELVADSPNGWKDAIEQAVEKASETIHNIREIEVKNLTASVEGGKVTGYKADLHLAFRVDE